MPEVHAVIPLASAIAATHWVGATERFWLEDRTAASVDPFAAHEARDGGDYVLAVGPEGGWSDGERALLGKSAKTGAAGQSRVARGDGGVRGGRARAGQVGRPALRRVRLFVQAAKDLGGVPESTLVYADRRSRL